jgi:hypothetical protein
VINGQRADLSPARHGADEDSREATELLPALVRYVECKALVGGVTTSPGIALFSAPGVRRYYKGIGRNVEETGDKLLPEAGSRIADVDAKAPHAFLAEIEKKTCFLLHLSEGTDDDAHKHLGASAPREQVGDRAIARRHPLHRAHRCRFRGNGRARRVDGVVAVQQPPALRPDREPRRRGHRRAQDRAGARLVTERKQEPVRRAQNRPRLRPEQRERGQRFDAVSHEKNLPDYVAPGLRALYGS